MGRTNYGRVGGRRSGGAIWQWMIIGLVFGFACSAVVVLALLTFGILGIDTEGTSTASEVTNTPFIVTATTDPNLQNAVLPTQTPFVVTATSEPTEELAVQQVAPPTATDIPEEVPTEEVPPTATEQTTTTQQTTDQQTTDQQSTGQQSTGQQNTTGSDIPALLEPLISDLVPVDGGTFPMGTDSREIAIAVEECTTRDGGACQISYGEDSIPLRSVTLDPFRIERTEVTNAQYVAFLNSMGAGSHLNGCSSTKCIDTQRENQNSVIVFDSANYSVPDIFANFPASGVTWYGAQTYCETIGRRLPTEAEWERAARGINNTLYPWGDTWVREYARVRVPNEGESDLASDVGAVTQNASDFGAFDMAGNVAEWVFDFYQADYYLQTPNAVNPQGPPNGVERVLRGGSWNTPPFFTRTVHRQSRPATDSFLWIGFRCADDVEQTTNVNPGAVNATDLGANVGNVPAVEDVPNDTGAAPTLPPRATPVGEPTDVPALPGEAGQSG